MSFDWKLYGVGATVVGRVVIVIDFSFPPPTYLVLLVCILEDIAIEMSGLPVLNVWIYGKRHATLNCN